MPGLLRFSLVGLVNVTGDVRTGGAFSSGGCDLTIDYTGKGNEGGVEVVGRWTLDFELFFLLFL